MGLRGGGPGQPSDTFVVEVEAGPGGRAGLVRLPPAVGGAVPVHESPSDDGEGAAVRWHGPLALYQAARAGSVHGAVERRRRDDAVVVASGARAVPTFLQGSQLVGKAPLAR